MHATETLKYLLIPLRGAALVLIVAFTLLLLIAANGGLLGLPLAFLVISWFFKYGFALLDRVADGVKEPPVLSYEMLNPANESRPLGLALLVIVFYAVTETSRSFVADELVTIVRTVALLLVPAIAILMYAWLACFAMIGGVLYVRRLELGFEPTHSPERDAEKANRDRQREIDHLIDGIFAEWRGGAYGNAWRTIERHLNGSRCPSEDLRDLFERASQWPDQRLAHRLAQELIPRLLATRRTADALNIARSQLQADAAFKPIASGDTIKLIELARDAGDGRTARKLLAGFAERYVADALAQRIAGQLGRQLER